MQTQHNSITHLLMLWLVRPVVGLESSRPPGTAEPLGGHAVQPGIVKQIDADPEGGYRVLVSLPLLQAPNDRGVWARLGSSYASDRVGISFFPEIGDEVAVGFLGGDPRYPVVLGSLHSKAKPPPNPPDFGNSMKSIVTKSGLRIDFAEDRRSVSIATPDGQTIQLDDAAKSVKLADRNGNRIAMDDKGVTIESTTDLRLSARGRIDIDPRPTQRRSRSG